MRLIKYVIVTMLVLTVGSVVLTFVGKLIHLAESLDTIVHFAYGAVIGSYAVTKYTEGES